MKSTAPQNDKGLSVASKKWDADNKGYLTKDVVPGRSVGSSPLWCRGKQRSTAVRITGWRCYWRRESYRSAAIGGWSWSRRKLRSGG